jgi:hypothetical protein
MCANIFGRELHRTPKPDSDSDGVGVGFARTKFFGIGIVKKNFSESELESKKILLGDPKKTYFLDRSWNRNRKKNFFGVEVGFRNQKMWLRRSLIFGHPILTSDVLWIFFSRGMFMLIDCWKVQKFNPSIYREYHITNEENIFMTIKVLIFFIFLY